MSHTYILIIFLISSHFPFHIFTNISFCVCPCHISYIDTKTQTGYISTQTGYRHRQDIDTDRISTQTGYRHRQDIDSRHRQDIDTDRISTQTGYRHRQDIDSRHRQDIDTDRISTQIGYRQTLFWTDSNNFLDKIIKKIKKLVIAIIENIE